MQVDKTNPVEIATDWLTKKDFRKNIQNGVAEILRKYIDLNDLTKVYSEQNDLNNFCPICSTILQEFSQDDVWVQGLKCSNGHVLTSEMA